MRSLFSLFSSVPVLDILKVLKREVSNIAMIAVVIVACFSYMSGNFNPDKFLIAIVCIVSVRNFKAFKLMLTKYGDTHFKKKGGNS